MTWITNRFKRVRGGLSDVVYFLKHPSPIKIADLEDFVYYQVKKEYARLNPSLRGRKSVYLRGGMSRIPQAARWKSIGRALDDTMHPITAGTLRDVDDCLRLLEERNVDFDAFVTVVVDFSKGERIEGSTRQTAKRLYHQHVVVEHLWFPNGPLFAKCDHGQTAMDLLWRAENQLFDSVSTAGRLMRVVPAWRLDELAKLCIYGQNMDLNHTSNNEGESSLPDSVQST